MDYNWAEIFENKSADNLNKEKLLADTIFINSKNVFVIAAFAPNSENEKAAELLSTILNSVKINDAKDLKNNYFTIEQVYCKDFLFANSYTTFRFDEKTNEFVMHKYSEAYTNRSNPDKLIPNKIKTIKDFGKIQFEAITQELLMKLVK